MAGSLNHIVDTDGSFTMSLIDNLGDAHEALEECYALIIELSGGDMLKVSAACKKLRLVDPWHADRYSDEPMPAAMHT
jgi:hypothetical protein